MVSSFILSFRAARLLGYAHMARHPARRSSFRFGACFLSVIAAVASQTARPYAKA